MEPEHRPRFQRVPPGASVPYKVDYGFGTAEKTYPVSALKGFVDHDSSLAPARGEHWNPIIAWLLSIRDLKEIPDMMQIAV